MSENSDTVATLSAASTLFARSNRVVGAASVAAEIPQTLQRPFPRGLVPRMIAFAAVQGKDRLGIPSFAIMFAYNSM
jgi:hypothetical protein